MAITKSRIDEILLKYENPEESLIAVLQDVQAVDGYISRESVEYITEKNFSGQKIATDVFTNCIINTVASTVPESVQLRDCFILNDIRTDNKSRPFDNALLLEKGPNVRQYVKRLCQEAM